MRPLAVLVLILGAVAALVFAFLRIQASSGDPGSTSIAKPNVGVQAAEPSRENVNLVDAGPRDPRGVAERQERVEVEVDGAEDSGDWNNWLAGTVIDPEGAPVAGASVELLRDAGPTELGAMMLLMTGNQGPKATKVRETDEGGAFRFARLEPGAHWSLRIKHPAYQLKQVGPIDVPSEDGVTEKIALETGFVIFGKVVAKGSQIPVSGASVVLENPAATYLPNLRRNTPRVEGLTDANGYFELANVTPAGMALVCTAEGYATQINQRDTSIVGERALRKQIDFELEPGQAIAGRVFAPDGSGVEGLRIDALGNNAQTGSRGAGVSGKGGEFLIADLAEGRYSLRVDQAGLDRLRFHSEMQQASTGDTNVEIRLLAQGGLTGVALGDDGPLQSFQVSVRQQHPTNAAFGHLVKRPTSFKDKQGRFTIGGLNEGTFVVQVNARGYASSFSEPVLVQQGEVTPDVTVQMNRGGTLSGVVVDIYTREPIAGAEVSTEDNNNIDSDFVRVLQSLAPTALTKAKVVTDAEGRFEIPLIMPETYQVRVGKRGYTSFVTNGVSVLEGTPTDLGIVALSKGATIRGTAYLPDGSPGAGVEVALSSKQPELGTGMRVRADSQGNFIFQNVPQGSYKLQGARPPKSTDSPFSKIIDMQKSAQDIEVVDGMEYSRDIPLGGG